LLGLAFRSFAGGNLGTPPFDPAVPSDLDYWVIETSSFQAADLASSPPVVGVTSLHPDHLDWHGTVDRYYADKLSACTQPGADLTVANGDDATLRAHQDQLGPRVQWVTHSEPPWLRSLAVLGRHNEQNALVARACIEALGVHADDGAIATAAEGFDGLASRLHRIGAVAGVDFVDDSLATNVLPTIAAVDAFAGRRIALIAGGHDRGIEYGPLAERVVARQAPTLVLTLPANGPRIAAAIAETPGAAAVEVIECSDIADAVRLGFRFAQPDGVVLLSPAAASFGQFRDYRERSAAFADAMVSVRESARSD
jgi:UDP-N-acetylmuramoylalanine--D-glutamate ligase